MRVVLVLSIAGIVAYLVFLVTVDVPMYFSRWRTGLAEGNKLLGLFEGLRDVSTRWVRTHDIAHWKGEIAWMSLYFSGAVWASLALCVFYSLEGELPQYRTEAAAISRAGAARRNDQPAMPVSLRSRGAVKRPSGRRRRPSRLSSCRSHRSRGRSCGRGGRRRPFP